MATPSSCQPAATVSEVRRITREGKRCAANLPTQSGVLGPRSAFCGKALSGSVGLHLPANLSGETVAPTHSIEPPAPFRQSLHLHIRGFGIRTAVLCPLLCCSICPCQRRHVALPATSVAFYRSRLAADPDVTGSVKASRRRSVRGLAAQASGDGALARGVKRGTAALRICRVPS